MASVELRNVDKVFPDGTRAVSGLSFDVRDGEFVVLVGPSGCGKSTILRMLAGLEEVTSGEILIDGRSVNHLPPQKRNTAMVFQNYALYPHKTVRQNLAFPLRMMEVPRDERNERISQVAEILGLTPWLDRRPKQLSGGQRQRVAMGRAMVRKPAVFLLDEPLSNLDAKLRVQVRAEIAGLQRRMQTTTVYVTHDQVEAMTLGERVAVLLDGQLQQVGTGQELYEQPANVFVAGFIGSPGMNIFCSRLRRGEGDTFMLEFGDTQLAVPNEVIDRYGRVEDLLDEPFLAGLRPEAFSPAEEASGTNRIRVRVASSEALGHENIVYFNSPVRMHGQETITAGAGGEEHAAGRMAARLPAAGSSPSADDEFTLAVDTGKLVLFSQEDGTLRSQK